VYARTTQLEIDTVRVPLDAALEMYRTEVVPRLREQPGFCGVQVLSTPDGRALILTFWDRDDPAATGTESSFYQEVLGRYATMFRSPPGRGWYEVLLATPLDAPAVADVP
jgi:heme-degrading monooxygenase HmoA